MWGVGGGERCGACVEVRDVGPCRAVPGLTRCNGSGSLVGGSSATSQGEGPFAECMGKSGWGHALSRVSVSGWRCKVQVRHGRTAAEACS
jgi:hypothetical protein